MYVTLAHSDSVKADGGWVGGEGPARVGVLVARVQLGTGGGIEMGQGLPPPHIVRLVGT